jgi:phospholipase C
MAMCGTSPLHDLATLLPDQPTVYDWLTDHGVRWRVYAAGLPFFVLMPRLLGLVLTDHVRRLDELAHDLATEAPEARPQVIFIEPDYHDSPVHLRPPCDNHPPLAMAAGEAFVAQVYQVLVGSPVWRRGVFVLSYDEHGGFFDHVAPLPVSFRHPSGVAFDTTGLRTPAIIAGPYARRGVSHVALDHTSILQLLAERFGRAGEGYSAEVQDRQRQGIRSVSEVLDAAANNTRICRFAPPVNIGAPTVADPSDLRASFDRALRNLVSQHPTEALSKYPELRGYLGVA